MFSISLGIFWKSMIWVAFLIFWKTFNGFPLGIFWKNMIWIVFLICWKTFNGFPLGFFGKHVLDVLGLLWKTHVWDFRWGIFWGETCSGCVCVFFFRCFWKSMLWIFVGGIVGKTCFGFVFRSFWKNMFLIFVGGMLGKSMLFDSFLIFLFLKKHCLDVRWGCLENM